MNYTILEVTLSIAVILITAFLIPFLRSKKSGQEWQEILNKVEIAVSAAEQIFDYKDNEKKYKYVDDFLKNTFKDLTVSDREALIQKTVNELKDAKNQLLE